MSDLRQQVKRPQMKEKYKIDTVEITFDLSL